MAPAQPEPLRHRLLAQASLVDPLTILIGLLSFVLLARFKVNATWLVVGGALIGLACTLGR